MKYAVIINGVVTNVIWLSESNAADFPAAVPIDDRPVAVGDTHDGNVFRRNGEVVLTEAERELVEAQNAYDEGVQSA